MLFMGKNDINEHQIMVNQCESSSSLFTWFNMCLYNGGGLNHTHCQTQPCDCYGLISEDLNDFEVFFLFIESLISNSRMVHRQQGLTLLSPKQLSHWISLCFVNYSRPHLITLSPPWSCHTMSILSNPAGGYRYFLPLLDARGQSSLRPKAPTVKGVGFTALLYRTPQKMEKDTYHYTFLSWGLL